MKNLIFLFSILILFSNSLANDNYIISQKGYIKIMPNFQMWSIEGNYDISETSFPIMVYYPISRKFNLSLRGNQANIAGDVNTLSGLTDTQLSCSYHLERQKNSRHLHKSLIVISILKYLVLGRD